MKDFDKLFDDLFSDDFAEIEAELDALDAEDAGKDENPAEKASTEKPDAEPPATLSFYDEVDDDEADDEDDEFIEDTEVGGTFDASCPYCGEVVSIFLDPAGGTAQDYVEDCSVCCQPMSVSVRFSGEGQADVMIDTTG